jgi:hypothetical protein|tara:strand:+ start:1364 stop:1594 length:231 start_codon:yes stop_codon:yes gene_type:complete
MEFEDEFDLSHLLFNERICRTCYVKKDLLTDFYLIRKNSKGLPSAYSYECKQCTKRRVTNNRRRKYDIGNWQYPDW